MRYYTVRIQVDFKTPLEMPPGLSSEKPWQSIGYFQNFYCTEKTKEKAKQLVYNYFKHNEANPNDCIFRFDRTAWLRGLKNIEQLIIWSAELTEGMFEKRNRIEIWFDGKKEYYVSEEDCAASFDGGIQPVLKYYQQCSCTQMETPLRCVPTCEDQRYYKYRWFG